MLTSDKPTTLTAWSVRDEAKLREAENFVRESSKRRQIAVDRVAAALKHAGFVEQGENATVLAALAIEHADAIRDALEPFDSGARVKPEVQR